MRSRYRVSRQRFGSPILPVGRVNPKKGECEYFNVYETWDGSTVEVFKDDAQKLRYVVTAGSGRPNSQSGEMVPFIHDQTRRSYGYWLFVESMPIEDLKASGLPTAPMYTYK